MIRLLKIEFSKLYHYRAARIFTLIYFVLLFVIVFGLTQDISLFGGAFTLNFVEQGAYTYPVVWQFITFIAAILKLFIAIVIITSITQEYSNRTLKQNLIDGLSKKEFLLSKVYTYVVISFVSTFILFLSGLILGEAPENSVAWYVEIDFLLYFFIKLVAFFGFCMLLAFLLRKSAFALLGFFLWFIIEGIVAGAEFFARSRFDPDKMLDIGPDLFSNYLPLSVMGNLIKNPFTRLESANMLTSTGIIKMDYSTEISSVIVALIYAILFVWLSYRLLKSRDL